MPKPDQLNRDAVLALMEAKGINGFAHLARRIAAISSEGEAPERSYLSRVLRGERTAPPSLVVLIALALKVPAPAITGSDLDADAVEALGVAS